MKHFPIFFPIIILINSNVSFIWFRPLSSGGKRSIFLTNTKALAYQQAEVIKKSTPLNVAVYTGDLPVEDWSGEKWTNEFEQNQV